MQPAVQLDPIYSRIALARTCVIRVRRIPSLDSNADCATSSFALCLIILTVALLRAKLTA